MIAAFNGIASSVPVKVKQPDLTISRFLQK